MADNAPKFIVDDDWKAQAQREKEQLTEQTAQAGAPPAQPGFLDLLNSLVMQTVMALGLTAMPNGERIPPNLETAKYLIDLLEVLDQKTKGNLSAEERRYLDQTLYDLRMAFVQVTSMLTGAAPKGPGAAPGSIQSAGSIQT